MIGMCSDEEYSEKLLNLGSMSYTELCILKQHCIHRHGFRGLKDIEEAIRKRTPR